MRTRCAPSWRLLCSALPLPRRARALLPARGLGAPSRPRSPFTIENDRHLVCFALQVGYGRWDDLLREVRKSWLFKFDWFVKTRVAAELGKRVEYLTKLIERELADEIAAKKEEERRMKKAGKAGGAGGKRQADEAEPAGGAAKRRKE